MPGGKYKEKGLGLRYSNAPTSVSNFTWVLERQGMYEEVELINRQALEEKKRKQGFNYPDALASVCF
jgi:hypothetical protein